MTAVSRADDRSRRLCTRLGAILTTNGFLTDIGTKVMRGKRYIIPADIPCTVLFEGDIDVPDDIFTQAAVTATYGVEAHFELSDLDNPNDDCHKAIADIKRVLWSKDDPDIGRVYKRLRYRGHTFGVREDGSKYASVLLMFSMQTAEDLMNP